MQVIILVLASFVGVSSFITGMKMGLTQSFVTNYKNSALPYYSQNITKHSLFQDLSFSLAQGVLTVNFNIHQPIVRFLLINLNETNLIFRNNSQLNVVMTDLSMEIHFQWKYSSLVGNDQGTGDLDINAANLNMSLSLLSNNGYPYLKQNSILFTIETFSFTFTNGTNDKILNNLSKLFAENVKAAVQEAIERYIGTVFVDDFNNYFVPNGTITKPVRGVSFAYNLTGNPITNTSYLEFDTIGVFVDHSNINYAPSNLYGNSSIPGFVANSSQIQLSFSEYSLNTLMYSLYTMGNFSANYESFEIGGKTLELTTTSLDSLFSGLSSVFGENVPVMIACKASKVPTITVLGPSAIDPNGAMIIEFNETCNVIVLSKVPQVASTVSFLFQFNATAYINQWVLTANIDSILILNTTAWSSSGIVPDIVGIQDFTNLLLNLAVPAFNQIVYQLPPIFDYATMTSTSVTLQKGYLYILSTPVFTFPMTYATYEK